MNLQVGVKIILTNEKNEWLLLRRAQAVSYGGDQLWDIPGGRIKPHENLMSALSRELSEETGMVLLGEPRLVAAQDIFVEPKHLHVVRLTYIGKSEGAVSLSDAHGDFTWVNRDKIDTLQGSIDPYLQKVIATL